MRRRAPAAAALLALGAALAPAAAAPPGLTPPLRVTAGFGDQFLGELTPDGQRLIYVNNENAINQVYAQSLLQGNAERLFDDLADASWPRVSPDGTRLLYISSREDALGDVCLYALLTKERRCLPGRGVADLQAAWFPDGSAVAVLSRRELHGDLTLRRLSVDGMALREAGELARNISGAAISPDGRWLAFVPLERQPETARAGISFLAQAATTLGLLRLGEAGERRVRVDLPGATGLPAFSRDGRHLYFTQYLNDTSLDGATNGSDNGVLFRVPFDSGTAAPIKDEDLRRPQQLTSAGWNCQYPSPAKDRLVATCAQRGGLSIYSLPLEGSAAPTWDRARLLDEAGASLDPWERLLLYARLLQLGGPEAERAGLLFEMLRLHLQLGEYGSAAYYTEKLRGQKAAPQGAATVLAILIAHREAERAIDRGQRSERFVQDSRDRLARLAALGAAGGAGATGTATGTAAAGTASPMALALAAVVRSEIHDTLGEKAESLALVRGLLPTRIEDRFVLHLYAARARDLLRVLGDRDALLASYALLAAHPALRPDEQLDYAGLYVAELLRGQPAATAAALVTAAAARAERDGALAFRLELEGWLLRLSPQTSAADAEAVRAGIFALYERHSDLDRRRALISTTIRRAAQLDNEYLTYQFANTWAGGLPEDRAERRFAERLYRQVVLDRAYISWGKGDLPDARGGFFGVTLRTDSLEAHIGFIEAGLREGRRDIEEIYQKRLKKKPGDPVAHFALSYLLARALPTDLVAQAPRLAEAQRLLDLAAPALSRHIEVHQLHGYLAHRRYLRGEADATRHAQEATTQYLLALDLARDRPRHRAALLLDLGLLQVAVGNFRLALGSLEERERLPFVDPEAQLAFYLAKARCLFYADRNRAAAQTAEAALLLIDQTQKPQLARYRPLALDRAALYHLVAGEPKEALARYVALTPLLGGKGERQAQNLLAHHLGRAAAEVGTGAGREALQDLARAEALLSQGATGAAVGAFSSVVERDAAYRLILFGLRARAHERLGDFAAAAAAMERRRDEVKARLARVKDDIDRQELALCESHLARYAIARGQRVEAARHLEAALTSNQAFLDATKTPTNEAKNTLLLSYAALHIAGGVPKQELRLDLLRWLEGLSTGLQAVHNPAWRGVHDQVVIYLSLLSL